MCTGLFIRSETGEYYQSRTLEFTLILDFIPVVTSNIIGNTLDGKIFADGINSNGLCVMTLYFATSESYNKKEIKNKVNLASYDVVNYFLNNASSVKDVIKLSKKINITQKPYGPPFNGVIPLHWFISDNTGHTIIVEAKNGELICYDNSKYRVCTNNPTYPEQVKNLKSLIKSNKFTYCNPGNIPHVLGTGLIGMPGDYSSFGRFARAYLLSQGMIIPSYKSTDIDTMFHFNNNFDIVYGCLKDCSVNPPINDFTQYTVVYDLTNLKAYYKKYNDQKIVYLGSLIPQKKIKKLEKDYEHICDRCVK